MEEMINKEFEKYQQDLEIREKKLKTPVQFNPDENLDNVLEELKEKKLSL